MTRDAIIENCRRLLSFFKDEDKYGDHQLILQDLNHKEAISCSGLLRSYGKILDYYGAPSSYMARLYLSDEDYSEFAEYAQTTKNFSELRRLRVTAISFSIDGYHWIVENK
jgi:hypothetical protein